MLDLSIYVLFLMVSMGLSVLSLFCSSMLYIYYKGILNKTS